MGMKYSKILKIGFGILLITMFINPAASVERNPIDQSVMGQTSSTEVVKSAFAGDGVNSLSYVGLVPGDIILLGTDDTIFDYLIPGEFSHTEIFCGFVQSGEWIWDRDNHEWMAPGTPYVIHSTKSDNAGNGLGYSTWAKG